MRERVVYEVLDEVHQPNRRTLDGVVLDVLGLAQGEREAVYEAVGGARAQAVGKGGVVVKKMTIPTEILNHERRDTDGDTHAS